MYWVIVLSMVIRNSKLVDYIHLIILSVIIMIKIPYSYLMPRCFDIFHMFKQRAIVSEDC